MSKKAPKPLPLLPGQTSPSVPRQDLTPGSAHTTTSFHSALSFSPRPLPSSPLVSQSDSHGFGTAQTSQQAYFPVGAQSFSIPITIRGDLPTSLQSSQTLPVVEASPRESGPYGVRASANDFEVLTSPPVRPESGGDRFSPIMQRSVFGGEGSLAPEDSVSNSGARTNQHTTFDGRSVNTAAGLSYIDESGEYYSSPYTRPASSHLVNDLCADKRVNQEEEQLRLLNTMNHRGKFEDGRNGMPGCRLFLLRGPEGCWRADIV